MCTTCKHVCMNIGKHLCVYVYICMDGFDIFVHICVFVRVHMCACVFTYVHTFMCTHTHTYMHMCSYSCVYVRKYIYIHTN